MTKLNKVKTVPNEILTQVVLNQIEVLNVYDEILWHRNHLGIVNLTSGTCYSIGNTRMDQLRHKTSQKTIQAQFCDCR